MNINRIKSISLKGAAWVAAIIITIGSGTSVHANALKARPLSPQEIHDNHLPEGTIASGGLFTVGVGEPVYLEALADQVIEINDVDVPVVVTGVTWNLLLAPAGSTAVIELSPIPMDMKIYSPPMREYLQVADRMMLKPDVEGQYLVEAVIHTDQGDVPVSEYITGAHYVGMGIVNDPAKTSPTFLQCAFCHVWDADDKTNSFLLTGHATFLEEAVDGIKSSHYGERCIECHVLGGHAPEANNGNFASAAAAAGWSWPDILQPGNWAAMPLEVKEKANIQCESCHGPGSEHFRLYEENQISLSLDSGDCAQCHDEEPYHNKNRQWEISGHAVRPYRASGSCAGCHTGEGFINQHNEHAAPLPVEGEAIVCAACHDPHSNEHGNHQLRTAADVELMDGTIVSEGGNGKFCINCHKSRRNAVDYVTNNVSSHYGPHYGVQGDLFVGTGAYDYGKVMGGASAHLYVVEDSCAGCHMQPVGNSDPAKDMVGEHTFKMTWDPNDTPDDHHDDMAKTDVCQDCHGPMDTFDIPMYDYNMDGVVEGVQTEVKHLMEALAMKLHPVGSPDVILGDSNHTYSDKEKKALYNYRCVYQDHSYGMHNPRYITNILRASINDMGDPLNSVLGGVNIPAGGPWFYSSWFDFYSPTGVDKWIYHVTHGYLHVDEEDGNLLIWDKEMAKWLYTNADLYPVMLDVDNGTWIYFQGKYGELRYFYDFSSSDWLITK